MKFDSFRKEKITALLTAEGIKNFGFCSFSSLSENLLNCSAASRLPENPGGVIVFAFPYLLHRDIYLNSDISRYAVARDYHLVVGRILDNACKLLKETMPSEEFVAFADSSPIPEVRAAALAGLGRVGNNGLLITEEYGSWVFIGEIVTSLSFSDFSGGSAHCPSCGLCEKLCPVGALSNGQVNKSKCLSAVTQKKGELTEQEKLYIKQSGCVWGCDKCQAVCPCNKNAKETPIRDFLDSAIPKANPEELSERAYGWRGKAVIQRNIDIVYNTEE